MALSRADLAALAGLCPGGAAHDVDLSRLSRWRIGGRADLVLAPASTAEVAALRRFCAARGARPVILGLTSNLLFADEGLRAPCIVIGPRMGAVRITGARVEAGAGAWVPGLARRLMQAGLAGGEHICGIPGTLGGLVCMNGGTARRGIGESVVEVESVDAAGRVRRRAGADCGFGYRRSVFQEAGEAITAATLAFAPGERAAIRAAMRRILAERRRKFPLKTPNCGSVFKSDPGLYAEIGPPGAAIERLGLKGLRAGDAVVSPLHANFIVNTGAARARDVLELIARIGEAVAAATGHRLAAEVRYVTPAGAILPADRVAQAA